MTFESLGIIETSSVSASLKTLSGLGKEKEIEIVGKQILGGGIVTLFIKGELGAIKRAISFGKDSLDLKSDFRSSNIIPLPHQQLLLKFGMEKL
jgi:ethanolamine utilization protein EutM